jgi:protein-disulfide isomerase
MKKVLLLISVCSLLMVTAPALAKTEWKVARDVELTEKPIDMAIAADGATAYILTKKSILIYSIKAGQVSDTIPLDKKYNNISVSPKGNTLLLTRGTMFNKSISEIQFTKTMDLPVGTSPVLGPVDARVTLTMFTDYQCPYCSKEFPVVEDLLKKYPNDLNMVIKHFPLGMHKFASQSAIAALAASKQGKYADLSRAMFKNYRKLNEELLQKLAKEVGLDIEKFNQDRKDSAFKKQLKDDRQLGRKSGVRGVPSLFVNGVLVKDRKLEGLARLVDAELKNK